MFDTSWLEKLPTLHDVNFVGRFSRTSSFPQFVQCCPWKHVTNNFGPSLDDAKTVKIGEEVFDRRGESHQVTKQRVLKYCALQCAPLTNSLSRSSTHSLACHFLLKGATTSDRYPDHLVQVTCTPESYMCLHLSVVTKAGAASWDHEAAGLKHV